MEQQVPPALRNWFVVHFAADLLFAVPLFVAPRFTLGLLGWETVDPVATRLVAAALFGIGIESLLGRSAGIESFRTMLTLKIIWSAAAVAGIAVSLPGADLRYPAAGWGLALVFLLFNGLWVYWRVRVGRIMAGR